MKKYILYTLLFAGLAASCNTEQLSDSDAKDNYADKSLKLDIKRVDFLDASETGSRLTNSGLETTFNEGDVIGVLVTQDGVNYNLPYKYDGTDWNFDTTKGKDLFIKTTEEALNYIIYYPYTEQANNVTTVEGLKTALPVLEDQSSEANYTASDVLCATVNSAENEISGTLGHLRSLFAFRTKVKFQTTVSAESEFEIYDVVVDNVSFSFGNKELNLFKTEDGEYRYIIDADKSITWIYEYKDVIYEGNKTIQTPNAGSKYTKVDNINLGTYELSNAKIGDLYCSSEENNGYIYPREYYSSNNNSINCIGIVFYVGKHTKDNSIYPEGMANNVHGYVMALKDLPSQENVNGLQWAKHSGGEYKEVLIENVDTSDDIEAWNGYSNTQTLYEATTTGGKNIDNFPLTKYCKEFDVSSPLNSSGWYIPSIAQLKYIWSDYEMFVEYLNSTKDGNAFRGKDQWYWSSTTYFSVYAQFVPEGFYGKGHTCDVRPILTF